MSTYKDELLAAVLTCLGVPKGKRVAEIVDAAEDGGLDISDAAARRLLPRGIATACTFHDVRAALAILVVEGKAKCTGARSVRYRAVR